MSDEFSKVEVITGVARRRRFSTEQKLAIVAETMQPGMSISYVARQRGLSPSLIFRWRRLMSDGGTMGDVIKLPVDARGCEGELRATLGLEYPPCKPASSLQCEVTL